MFTEEMPKLVAGYFKLFEAVENHFRQRCAIERLSSQGELALVFKTAAGEPALYFALRWDLWSRMNIPLWLGVRPDWSPAGADEFAARHPGMAFTHDGYLMRPFDQSIAVDCDNPQPVIDSLYRELAAAGVC